MDPIDEIRREWQRIGDEVKAPLAELKEMQLGFQSQLLDLQQRNLPRSGGHGGGLSVIGGAGPGYMHPGDGVNFAELFSHEDVRALASGKSKNMVTIGIAGGIDRLTRAAVTTITVPGEMQRLPRWGGDARRPLRLLDTLPVVQMQNGSAQYMQLGAYVNAAGYQLVEGSAKPEQDMPTTIKLVEAATIAVTLPISTQVLADVTTLETQVKTLLIYGVLEKLEREIIAGPGTAGTIAGLAGAAAAFTATAGLTSADRIGEAAATLQALGWSPNLVIMNPADWFKIAAAHATGGEYVIPSGWNLPPRPNIWGLDTVLSAGAVAGSALVIDTAQVAYLDRQQTTIDVGYTGDQFKQNLLTLRCELRGALAVFSPSALLEVALV
jgi:HK97 family phage major capsid protein